MSNDKTQPTAQREPVCVNCTNPIHEPSHQWQGFSPVCSACMRVLEAAQDAMYRRSAVRERGK